MNNEEKQGFFLSRSLSTLLATVFFICTSIVLADALVPGAAQLAVIETQYGKPAAQRVRQWQQLIAQSGKSSELEMLELVNQFFNRIPFISDKEHWGVEDYWATPTELLITHGGDCEDFSIAKYFTLRALGVSIDKLRLIYVKAITVNQAHMILAYYATPTSEPLILDNLDKTIKPGSLRRDLIPVYSFNGDYLWLAQEMKGRSEMVGSSSRISLWNKVRKRMQKEHKLAGSDK